MLQFAQTKRRIAARRPEQMIVWPMAQVVDFQIEGPGLDLPPDGQQIAESGNRHFPQKSQSQVHRFVTGRPPTQFTGNQPGDFG